MTLLRICCQVNCFGLPFPMPAMMPTAAMPMMVVLIETLVVMVADLVIAPIGVTAMKILVVTWMGAIPVMPFRPIPVTGSDDVGLGIRIIRGPAISGAEKVLQDPILEPVTVVVDPWGVGTYPRGRGRPRRRRWIILGIGRPGQGCEGPRGQHEAQHQDGD